MLYSSRTFTFVGLTEGEKEEKARAKEALNADDSEDEGDIRKAATYGNKKTEVTCCAVLCHTMPGLNFTLLR